MLISRRLPHQLSFDAEVFVRQIKRFFATCAARRSKFSVSVAALAKFNEYCHGFSWTQFGNLKLRVSALTVECCESGMLPPQFHFMWARWDNVRKRPCFHSVGLTAKVDYPGSTILTSLKKIQAA